MKSCIIVLFLAIHSCITTVRCIRHVRDYGADFDRTEIIPGTKETLIKVWSRKERAGIGSDVCVYGNMTYVEDLGRDVEISISVALNKGGNVYVQLPVKLPWKDFCEFINTTWRVYVAPTAKGVSTLPEIPPEGLCPFPKGAYKFDCFILKPGDNWPSHFSTGTLKIMIQHRRKGEFVGGTNIYIDIFALK